MRKTKAILVSGLLISILSPQLDLIAQEDIGLNTAGVEIGQLGDCFDTYRFGSLEIELTPSRNQYKAGEGVIVKGTVKNGNNYPLVGIDIMARVVKDIPNANDQAYTKSIEEFIVGKNLTLDAGESRDIETVYNLSTKAEGGEYEMYFFGYQENRFNITGLSFTDDIYGSRLSFSVENNNNTGIYFDQTRTTVGGQKHINHAYVTKHEAGKAVDIKIPLKNTTDQVQKVKIEANLYKWDGLREENIERTNSREITIPARGEVEMVETVANPYLPVYYLKLKANIADKSEAQRQESLSNIRFVVENLNAARFNWVGLNTFPKAAGQEGKIVTCIHNTSNGVANGISVETKVTDQNGREIASSVYRGDIGGAISAVEAQLPKDRVINKALITSVLRDKDGKVIDSVNIMYDCNTIGNNKCIAEPVGQIIVRSIVGIIGGIIVLGLVIYSILLQKRRKSRISSNQ
ncbi:MAG: hypothetical protein RLZZ223_565 [Candidatus Parcubacteria bacterium]